MTESQHQPQGIWIAIHARVALAVWLAVCGLVAAVVGLPVLLASLAVAVAPAYASGRRGRGFVLPFELAIVGAGLGALAFSHRGIVAATIGALVTGAVVGIGLSQWAMWIALTRKHPPRASA